jgi:hypothetical protein
MAMSELKQMLLKQELAKIGFPDAVYIPESDKIKVQPDNERLPFIDDEGAIWYGTEHDNFVKDTIRPLVDRVNELTAAQEKKTAMPSIITPKNDAMIMSNFRIRKRTFEGKHYPAMNDNPVTSKYYPSKKYAVLYDVEGYSHNPVVKCYRTKREAEADIAQMKGEPASGKTSLLGDLREKEKEVKARPAPAAKPPGRNAEAIE